MLKLRGIDDRIMQLTEDQMALDEYAVKYPQQWKQIGFSRIDHFKGLENDAIIVVDISRPSASEKNIALHYVAMSRARSVLSLVYR